MKDIIWCVSDVCAKRVECARHAANKGYKKWPVEAE